MKRVGYIFALAFLPVFNLGCSEKASVDKPIDNNPPALTEVDSKLVAAGNEFTWELFREVVRSEETNAAKNIFLSPLSASIALGMTYNGARGETQTAMQSTLGFSDVTPLQINESYQNLIAHFAGLDANVKFEIANSIWHANWFEVEPEFLDVNRRYFDAVVSTLDFSSPEAVVTINDWVSDRTNGKIATILESIPDNTVMYLINALYFKGTWTYKFARAKTRPMEFNCPDGRKPTCQFMSMRSDSVRFIWNSSVTGIELPYGSGDYRFLAVMPTHHDSTIDALVAGLDGDTWTNWLASLNHRDDLLMLPKFKLSYETNLKDQLSSLGMGVAFTDQADFTGINRNGNLLITAVKQKTFVQLDEEGTEAAAVTAVEVGITNAGPSFVFDRPFLMTIYDHQSGAVLFIGKIVKPEFSS